MIFWRDELKLSNGDSASSGDGKKEEKPSLLRALRKCYIREFIISAILKLFWGIFLLLGAFYFVRSLVKYVQEPDDPYKGWLLAVFFFFDCLLLSICLQQMSSFSSRLGIRVRSALVTAVYNKSLIAEGVGNVAGDVLNLVANDCSRLLEGCTTIHYLWSGPIEALAIISLLIYLIGNSAFVGLGLLFILFPVQYLIGVFVTKIRRRGINITDGRIQIMHEILLAIKLVKFYAWEKSFAKEVEKIRAKELRLLRKSAFIKSFNLVLVFSLPPLLALGIFGTYVAIENKLEAAIAFTTLSLFNTLRFPLVVLPKAIRGFAECLAAIGRIEVFLLSKESPPKVRSSEVKLEIKNATFGYRVVKEKDLSEDLNLIEEKTEDTFVTVLRDINMEIPRGKLAAICGPVGSGKSTLISSILGDTVTLNGETIIGGKIAYVPQTPWIRHATARDNILFGLPFDEEKYRRVIHACALERDFEILVNGDLTEIGERGINLSGGQKQRIALARAAYSEHDIFLLDSPLSAVDGHTSLHIFQHCLRDLLRDKTILLIAHQLDLLHHCDLVGVMKGGKLEYFGAYQKDLISTFFPGWVDHADESSSEEKTTTTAAPQEAPKVKLITRKETNSEPEAEQQKKKRSNIAVYRTWAKNAGYYLVAISGLIFAGTQIVRIMSDYWISIWTGDEYDKPERWYTAIYGAFVGAFMIMLLIRGAVFYSLTLKASTKLHNRMFAKVLRAPIGFFTVTPLGPLLNCFSKDQDTVDEALPDATHMTIIYTMILLTTLTLVCVVLPYYALVAAALVASFAFMQHFYLRSSRILRGITGNTNSPIFANVSETLNGISVIRAFEVEEQFKEYNIQCVNRNHKAQFAQDHLGLWLSFHLDTIASALVCATALFCVGLSDTLEPRFAGLAISNSIQKLVFFTLAVKGFADIDANINAVDRISRCTKTTTIQKDEKQIELPSSEWPTRGCITFTDVVMRYFPHSEPVLKKVSFTIQPGEKIGVVGRTGSGKSSLLMTLFRLCEPDEGQIVVDDVDICKLGLEDLRSHLSIIPQEPVMFKGTIRTNLDPFGEYTDKDLWNALELSHLKSLADTPAKLETPVVENGNNFSLGQKQLVCLARAILKNSKVIVLDEATSAIDLETDTLIQKTIRNVFADRTVITIAHRMDTIIDSDRILVMDAGNAVEFDTVKNLLKDSDGYFTKLVKAAGLRVSDFIGEHHEKDAIEIGSITPSMVHEGYTFSE